MICDDFNSRFTENKLVWPRINHTHFDMTTKLQSLVGGKKYSQWRGSRKSCEYFSHTYESWFTVCFMTKQLEYHSTIAWQNLPLRVLSWWLFEPSCSWRVPRCLSSPRLPNIAGAPTGSTMPTIWKSKIKKSQVMDS